MAQTAARKREYMKTYYQENKAACDTRSQSWAKTTKYKSPSHRYSLALRLRNFRYRYGVKLTPEQYKEMVTAQQGRCAICNEVPVCRRKQELCIDHDHSLKIVRGLLCTTCNIHLGILEKMLKSNFVELAETYLRRYS